jgi:glycosyltransferase involved in cell wall biosynthesis
VIVVIFHRLGPYHWARLQAASREYPLLAIELSAETSEYPWDKVEAEAGFKRVTLFLEGDSRNATPRELAKRLIACLETHPVKVVAIPGWSDKGGLTALQWCVQHKVPAVVMSESTDWDDRRVLWKECIKRKLTGMCASALVGGKPHRDYMVKLGMPAEQSFLGYDAVDNGYFSAMAEQSRKRKAENRRNYGLPEHYFLASARFIEKKNLPRLIQAYALYRQKAESLKPETLKSDNAQSLVSSPVVPWSLVLLGDGELRSSLESQVSSLNLHAHVQMPGFKQYPDLPAYYGLASAFIHASTTEQWGLVVNEAMASGLPVLVSNRCGCAQDLVQEGVNGYTFDPYNVEQMAELMLKISSAHEMACAISPGLAREAASPLSPGNCPLSAFGASSARIVSEWGPDRFANGLKQAADCALQVGPVEPTLLQRTLLRVLLAR